MLAAPSTRGSATAFLLTVLGEFALPSGGAVWTADVVRALGALDISESNARQALARTAEQGTIEPERQGRAVRWRLTVEGRRLLETGTDRIYAFGQPAEDWDERWLLVHCAVAETMRPRRDRLRTQLAFLGLGELSPSVFVSPHVVREPEIRGVLTDLGLDGDGIVATASVTDPHERDRIVRRAWDLEQLAGDYERFIGRHESRTVSSGEKAFAAIVQLVHDWRSFPFADPELPADLLPADWIGTSAAELFRRRHDEWSPEARAWFAGAQPS